VFKSEEIFVSASGGIEQSADALPLSMGISIINSRQYDLLTLLLAYAGNVHY
jgi:hypothetical protein